MNWENLPWVSIGIMVLCVIIFAIVLIKDIHFTAYAFQYDAVVKDGQYWRGLTSQMNHADVMHLGLNMFSVYNLQYIEKAIGHVNYIILNVVILLMCPLFILLITKISSRWFPLQRETYMVGFSCVLFGLFVVAAFLFPNARYLMWGAEIPALVMPLITLVLTHLMVPSASVSGHVSGMLSGLVIGLALKFSVSYRNWMSVGSVLLWCCVAVVICWVLVFILITASQRSLSMQDFGIPNRFNSGPANSFVGGSGALGFNNNGYNPNPIPNPNAYPSQVYNNNNRAFSVNNHQYQHDSNLEAQLTPLNSPEYNQREGPQNPRAYHI